MVKLAAVILLPLNFSLFAVLKERGVMTFDGLIKVGMVAAQAIGVFWIAQGNGPNGERLSAGAESLALARGCRGWRSSRSRSERSRS